MFSDDTFLLQSNSKCYILVSTKGRCWALRFQWDEDKNALNIIKHGISFKEAESVFDDERAILIYDEPHSSDEDRFIIIGIDMLYRELTVCHCYREDGEIVRIISARKATKNEIELYSR